MIYSMLHIYRRTEALEYLKSMQIEQIGELNIFNHPDFLRPALECFAADDCGLLAIKNPQAGFLMPFQVVTAGLGFAKTISGWRNIYAMQGTPLISIQAMADTLISVIHELSKPEYGLPNTLLLHNINLNAPFAKALHELATRKNLPLHVLRQEERPVLRPPAPVTNIEPEHYLSLSIGKNHRRDYRRLWRRLAETGTLEYRIATDQASVLNALEDFLKLEISGWKGKSGTAFLNNQQHAEFIRKAVSNLAAHNLVRIHMLTLDSRSVASLIVFIDRDQAWTWKTAYDEALRAFSPGVLLMIEVLKNHLENPALRITDSCAIPDHPVMSRLFHERESFGTIIIGLTDQSTASVKKITRQLNRYDRLIHILRHIKSRIKKYRKA